MPRNANRQVQSIFLNYRAGLAVVDVREAVTRGDGEAGTIVDEQRFDLAVVESAARAAGVLLLDYLHDAAGADPAARDVSAALIAHAPVPVRRLIDEPTPAVPSATADLAAQATPAVAPETPGKRIGGFPMGASPTGIGVPPAALPGITVEGGTIPNLSGRRV